MRVAAEAACAVRPIAQISWRVVMALKTPSFPRLRSRNKVKSALTASRMACFLAEAPSANQAGE